MGTYSINIGTELESTSYRLPNYLQGILSDLPDNEDKLIRPERIRNALLSLWDSVPFKQTYVGNKKYIGIDTGNITENKDLKRKFLLGKRSFSGFGGSYSASDDILNEDFLSSDTDIFFYNTKSDDDSQITTRLSLLSGDLFLHQNAPYIQSQFVSGASASLSIDFVNNNGVVKLNSTNASVFINNIEFPTIQESGASASNGKVLTFDGNKLEWDFISFPELSTLGTSSEALNFYGDPVNVNGYPIEFSDTRQVPVKIGDIVPGSTFSKFPISEMLRRIIYTYNPPTADIRILPPFDKGYVEVGTAANPIIEYKINKKTLPTLSSGVSNVIFNSTFPPITAEQYFTTEPIQAPGVVIAPITTDISSFTITVSDGQTINQNTVTLRGVYPYFFGFSNKNNMSNIELGNLTKLVDIKSDKNIDFLGSGNLFFIYDLDYGQLDEIVDDVGNNLPFTFTTQNFISPDGFWADKDFYVYKIENITINELKFIEFRY